MVDIPLNADVECIDGPGGRSSYVIINPTTEQVTHMVIRKSGFQHIERLIPIDWIVETTPNSIRLRCTKDELAALEPFIETSYISVKRPRYDRAWYDVALHVVPEETVLVPEEHKRTPQGELAVHQGARVEAADGRVGRVEEFLVDATDSHITHLVLREGPLWNQKNVLIPVSQIERVEEETIYLKLDKRAIGSYPAIPIRRPAARSWMAS